MARHKQAGTDGNHLSLIDLRLAHFDLKQRYRGIFSCCGNGGWRFTDDEANLIGFEDLSIHQHLLRWNDKLARFVAGDPPVKLRGNDLLRTLDVDFLPGGECRGHSYLDRESQFWLFLDDAVLYGDDVFNLLPCVRMVWLEISAHRCCGGTGNKECQEQQNLQQDGMRGEFPRTNSRNTGHDCGPCLD